MNSDFLKSLAGYKAAMFQAKKMFLEDIITAEDYSVIETKMSEKYRINSCSLYRENDWINTNFRGNIPPIIEEV